MNLAVLAFVQLKFKPGVAARVLDQTDFARRAVLAQRLGWRTAFASTSDGPAVPFQGLAFAVQDAGRWKLDATLQALDLFTRDLAAQLGVINLGDAAAGMHQHMG